MLWCGQELLSHVFRQRLVKTSRYGSSRIHLGAEEGFLLLCGHVWGPAGGTQGRSNGGGWLETLKAKAGKRCYNCLSAGHRIADCRDPPRCLLCSRFGHKARSHFSPHISSSSRAAAAAPVPPCTAATSAAPRVVSAAASSPRAAAASAVPRSTAAACPAFAAPAKQEDGYVLSTRIPGAPDLRPGHVRAGVARTVAVREEERALETFALLAVQVDARVRLDTARVNCVSRSLMWASRGARQHLSAPLRHAEAAQ